MEEYCLIPARTCDVCVFVCFFLCLSFSLCALCTFLIWIVCGLFAGEVVAYQAPAHVHRQPNECEQPPQPPRNYQSVSMILKIYCKMFQQRRGVAKQQPPPPPPPPPPLFAPNQLHQLHQTMMIWTLYVKW